MSNRHHEERMVHPLVRLLLFASFLGYGAPRSCAESARAASPAPLPLSDMVVTATRRERPPEMLPNSAVLLVGDDIRLGAPMPLLPEALAHQPAVMLQKTAVGQGSPYIRGFTGFRNLLLVDGVRFNRPVFRDGPNQYWNLVDPAWAERFELVLGPTGVLYGSDAVGGTVNVLTGGLGLALPRDTWERRFGYRFSSADGAQTGRMALTGNIADRLGIQVGATGLDIGDLRAGKGSDRQDKTGYDQWSGNLKFQYRLAPGHEVTFAHFQTHQDDVWRTHATMYGQSWHGTTVGTDRRRSTDQAYRLSTLAYRHTNQSAPIESLDLLLSHQELIEDELRVRANGAMDRQGFTDEALGASLALGTSLATGHVTYGVDYTRDRVDSHLRKYAANGTLASVEIQGPVADDAVYEVFGVFAQGEFPLGSRFELTLGSRYEQTRARAGKVRDPLPPNAAMRLSDEWRSVITQARLMLGLTEARTWNAFAGVAQSFRSPNLSDLTRYDIARSGELETAATGLDPERYLTFEFGVRGRMPDGSVELALFRTEIHDLIVRTPTGAVIGGNAEVTKRNAGAGYVHGFEFKGEWRLHEQLTARGLCSWLEGEVDGYPTAAPVRQREPLSRLMPATAHLGLEWAPPEGRFTVELLCTLADRQDTLSASDRRDTQRIPPGGTPGYAVFSLRSTWRATDHLRLAVALENVFDKDHRVHGSGVNEPGRNLVLAGELVF